MARPPIEEKENNGKLLTDDYFVYPHRSYGMDHERYQWSLLKDRKPVKWPSDKKIALWINIALEFFPLNMPSKPFKALGGTVTSYPDLRHFTLRDYGNRIGFFRVSNAIKSAGFKNVTVAFNSEVAQRYPYLVDHVNEKDWEIIGHGINMSHLSYTGLGYEQEEENISIAIDSLEKISNKKLRGWWSPGRSESWDTPDIIAKKGIEYFCDWINDDMPYQFNTSDGVMIAMPHQHWISDAMCYLHYKHKEQDFIDQAKDQFNFLLQETKKQGGRIMAITIHPWASGQPHRIKALEEVLNFFSESNDVWNASGYEIMKHWKEQQ